MIESLMEDIDRGVDVVASVSGGKDSAALALWLIEQDIEHRRVFIDTGWEWDGTYDYINGELERVIGPIETIRGDMMMADLVRKKGMFPSRLIRFCTQDLKAKAISKYLKAMIGRGEHPVNAVGIRGAESASRAKMVEWEYQDYYNTLVWRPLIRWTMDDVVAIHRRHGLSPNPLYLKGASRVGCWPCIFARKAEIRLIAQIDPGRIDLVRDLEHQIGDAAEARYRAKNETLDSLGYKRPTWFHTHGKNRALKMVPIDEAVEWSRTSYGGKQMEMFEPPMSERGCMRWGLCDAMTEEG